MSHTVTSTDERTRIHFNPDFSGMANLTRSTDTPSAAFKGAVEVAVESFSFDASVLKTLVDRYVADAFNTAINVQCYRCREGQPVERCAESYIHPNLTPCYASEIHGLKEPSK